MATSKLSDNFFMEEALKEAQIAASKGEVPVGALIVHKEKIIARAHNLRETTQDPLAHAEILAIQAASKHLGSWRLIDCSLYVTLEPCLMCAGTILQSRIPRLIFGAADPKGGACTSLYEVLNDSRLNHQVEIVSGILAEPSSQILKQFFHNRR